MLVAAAVLPAPEPGSLAGGPAPSWLLPYDDAYIHLRYAQTLHEGNPGEWSPGTRSTGSTSVLFALLLVPVTAVTSDLAWLSWGARVVGVLTLVLAAAEGAAWLRRDGHGTVGAALGAAAVALGSAVSFSAIGGMDAALAAALVLRWARTWGAPGHLRWAAVAPWIRPDLGVLTIASVIAGARRDPRALLALLPGALLAAWCRWASGEWLPAGALGKSVFAAPYATWDQVGASAWHTMTELVGRVYLGAEPLVLAPGVGIVALLGAVLVLRRAPALVGAWAALLAIAPLSTHLSWQLARHHQPALVVACVLAAIALARLLRRWSLAVIPLLAWSSLPAWRAFHAEAAETFRAGHGPFVGWLQAHPGTALVTHEAGIYALLGLGPAYDTLGLGTPAFTRAAPHREGAVLETLARQRPAPQVAAFDPGVVDLAPLLGDPLVPRAERLLAAPVRADLLAAVDDGALLDFGYLPDEARFGLTWTLPPLPNRASLALLAIGADGRPTLQGCRPVRGTLDVALPAGAYAVRWTLYPGREGTLTVRERAGASPLVTVAGEDGVWTETPFVTTGGLRLENDRGPACVESLRPGDQGSTRQSLPR